MDVKEQYLAALTRERVAYDLERALIYMDRGLLSAADRVATDLTKDTGVRWTRKDVFKYLGGFPAPAPNGSSITKG